MTTAVVALLLIVIVGRSHNSRLFIALLCAFGTGLVGHGLRYAWHMVRLGIPDRKATTLTMGKDDDKG